MKTFSVVVLICIAVFVVAVVIGDPGPAGTPQEIERKKSFCAQSPAQREMAYIDAWQRERHRPGSPWSTYQEFKDGMRRYMGC